MSSEQAVNALGLVMGVQVLVSPDGYEGLVAQVMALIEDKETAEASSATASRVLRPILRRALRRMAELEKELGDTKELVEDLRDEIRARKQELDTLRRAHNDLLSEQEEREEVEE